MPPEWSEMTHFVDLELIQYHNGPCDADQWQCPLLAIGWVERGEPFATGPCQLGVVEKLLELQTQFKLVFPEFSFRGMHKCSICGNGSDALNSSHVNLFIPGKEAVYLAPGGVDHYIQTHSYLPPQEFLEALLGCPDPGSMKYAIALRDLNHGKRPPLFPERWNIIRVEDSNHRVVLHSVGDHATGLEFARMYSLQNPTQEFEVEQAPDRFSQLPHAVA